MKTDPLKFYLFSILAPVLLSFQLSASGATATVASRPPYNSGNGFFVYNGKLYDANGYEFHIRGVNRLHWTSDSEYGIARSHANTVRWAIDFSRPPEANVNLIRSQSIRHHIVPILGNWAATCSPDPAKLDQIVSTWITQARQWTRLDRYLIVNVANEWGPANSTIWRDAYIRAVHKLRSAGYLGTILIDSGGCGQDMQDLIKYSADVFESDPQRNIMFAVHLYGRTNAYSASIHSVTPGDPTIVTLESHSPTHPFAPDFNGRNNSYSGITDYLISGVRGMTRINGLQPALQNVGGTRGAWTVTLQVNSKTWGEHAAGGMIVDGDGNYAVRIRTLAELTRRTGAVYIIGEFGPGNDIGPSATQVTPMEIVSAAETNNVGWLAWAWDDNDLPNCMSDDKWFSMTYRCGTYTTPKDLTRFGRYIVLDPRYGLQTLSKSATVF